MANSLLRDLDSEWASISTSVWARRSVNGWADHDQRFGQYRDLREIVEAIRHRDQAQSTKLCWALLGRVANGDELATRTLLQAMVPKLGGLLRKHLRVVPAAGVDVDQLLVTAANQAIHEMAHKRPQWPILDIASRTSRLFDQSERKEQRWEQMNLLDDRLTTQSQEVAADEPLTTTDELAALLNEVAATGSLSSEELAMVWITRVEGVSTDVAAAAYGSTPAVFRRRRLRVEARFVEALRAAA